MPDPTAPLPELPPAALRWRCDPGQFPREGSPEIPPIAETMGQERALDALRLGLELYAPGYNVFVTGLTGTGRASTVKRILENIQPACALAPDRCYVHDFHEPDRPRLLTLPRATARFFRDGMADLLGYLRRTVPAILEDPGFKKERDAIFERHAKTERAAVRAFAAEAEAAGFALVQIQIGPVVQPEVLPLLDGKPVPIEQLETLVADGKLTPERAAELVAAHERLQTALADHLVRARELARRMTTEVEALGRGLVRSAVAGPIADLKKKFPVPAVAEYLDEVEMAVLGSIERFAGGTDDERPRRRRTDHFLEFQVNVIQDQFGRTGCPVVVETAPSYSNLFGTIEREPAARGQFLTDHMKIRPGALLQADGGYLVVNAMDVFTEPGVWTALKRTLKSGLLHLRPPDYLYVLGPPALRPEPIPVTVKVVIIGDGGLYHLAAASDEDFGKIFKVLAEFEAEVPRTDASVGQFAQVAAKICRDGPHAALDPDGLAALVEFGVRRAGRQAKLSVRFSEVADVVRQADFWRGRDPGAARITRAHVTRAIAEHRKRHSLTEEHLREYIREGILRVDVSGAAVGQVNGLAVYDYGVYAFGKPSRISATTSPGRHGVINIEREARLSGTSHDKGVLILSGFLRHRYAAGFPLALTASVAFEQSYGGVDGDSASSTEIYALLSSLAGVPIRQGCAVTGSVDQFGTVQAIGGVNEKIEGFYDVCVERGLSGDQGVLVPTTNAGDLMLREDVVEAVRAGKFHVWPVATIDQGITRLTGIPAGTREADGGWTPGSVNARVQATLERYAKTVAAFEGRAP